MRSQGPCEANAGPKQRMGEAMGVFCIVLLVQQMHMGEPSDAHGKYVPHFPMRLHCMCEALHFPSKGSAPCVPRGVRTFKDKDVAELHRDSHSLCLRVLVLHVRQQRGVEARVAVRAVREYPPGPMRAWPDLVTKRRQRSVFSCRKHSTCRSSVPNAAVVDVSVLERNPRGRQ